MPRTARNRTAPTPSAAARRSPWRLRRSPTRCGSLPGCASEAEFHGELARRRVEDLALEETIEAYVRLARHTLDATAPEAYRGPVILSGRAVADLFNAPLVFERGPYPFQTSAQAAFQGVSRFTVGQPVTPEPARGD